MSLFGNRQATDALHDNSELLSLLNEHAGVGLWDAKLVAGDPAHAQSQWRWSPTFRRLLGFAGDDRRAFPDAMESWSDRLHPEDVEPTFAAFQACLADRSGATGYDVIYRLRMKDETYRWFRAVGGVSRTADGIATRACGALIDVHAEKEEAERLEVLDRFAGVGLWDAVLHEGDPMHARSRWRWSPVFRMLLGFSSVEEFPDTVHSWSDRLHPEDAGPTFEAFGACLADATGKTGYDVNYRLKLKNGDYRWFRAVGGVVRDRTGKPVRACGSLIDIHEQQMAEKQQSEAEIERRQLIEGIAEQLGTGVSNGTERAASSAQTVASAADELATSIATISEQVSKAAESANMASDAVSATDRIMQTLAAASDRIGTVVKLINDIASQTNLLALNATIEAARAGEEGRGFAVVAKEVKTLAKQTADATGEIGAQISAIQSETASAVEAISEIGNKVHGVREISSDVSASITQQNGATQEIAREINRVVQEIQEVSSVVDKTAAGLRSSATAA